MVLNLPDTTALLQGAFAAGNVRLVDEHAKPITYEEAMGQRCWAHLRDAADQKEYVHELKDSRDLLALRYLEMLIAIV